VADFPLVWWNAGVCGGYDLVMGWAVDKAVAADMCVVFRLVTRANGYPDMFGYGPQFEALVRAWRLDRVTGD
jgi:hypothetical protein